MFNSFDMIFRSLAIHRFRNLQEATLTFHPGCNFIFGDNAQGKTNMLESVYVLCLAKSFRAREDAELVPFDEDSFFIEGDFDNESGISRHVSVLYSTTNGKQIKIDGKKLQQFSKLIGQCPVVILSADDYSITSGPPAQRRRFFNIFLSQSSNRYLDNLKNYDKVLKQRNTLLSKIAEGHNANRSQLETWNTQLIRFGAQLMLSRQKMIERMNEYVQHYYKLITESDVTFSVIYESNVPFEDEKQISECFQQKLKRVARKEQFQGTSIAGPHRDEFVFKIGDRDLRRYGSRGEHKSVLVSLKAAEVQFLKQSTDTQPILLLDDLYAELDRERSHRVLDLFEPSSQLFVTGTSSDYAVINGVESKTDKYTFFVKGGKIEQS